MSRIARILRMAIRPRFLKPMEDRAEYHLFSNYFRLWGLSMLLLAGVALVPLLIMAAIDYKLTEHSLHQQLTARLDRVTSNTRRSVTYFLDERVSALTFLIQEESFEDLSDPEHLAGVLRNLKIGFGGLVDLGVIDDQGRQIAYAGPYALEGREYGEQQWFMNMPEQGVVISEIFMGFRNVPHMFIAVRSSRADEPAFVMRATLDIGRLTQLLGQLAQDGEGDAFLINAQGVVQTPSRDHGEVLKATDLPVPEFSEHTRVFRHATEQAGEMHVGYAFITGSPFILMVAKSTGDLMLSWKELRLNLMGFLIVSIIMIVAVNYVIATYMINKAHAADTQQARAFKHMEDTNRLASIGRLAAGVAHEINNPLAIINMKAGLIKDLLNMRECETDARLIKHIDAVLQSVERCGLITKQLLGFARQVDLKVEELSVRSVVTEVLSFLEKEASYRNIKIELGIPDDLPAIQSDRAKLQQILLNIIGNAFQAMNNGGNLTITAVNEPRGMVAVDVADTGEGIDEDNLKKIFDPFFTTKAERGGSGLGLSITYGLVRKLGGNITVKSEQGKGTTFTISLPVAVQHGEKNANPAG